jgi:hypothetical protein
MNSSQFIDAKKFPTVYKLLKEHVEMQFGDIRVLLQLPLGTTSAPGGNLATGALVLNLISGFSVCLFNATKKALLNTMIAHRDSKTFW